ncbi:hypothetical protein [Fibrella forsythiae]|uniref:Uncharacterized protein n=1 Tax=Fibrella forsythiae TaxID=2817061 RepID=A0ABS3JBV8_9BACT|nr:hypothetical protein [Fibrella forsythiae]MBO0947472.1 hypothetical protein [Fibrella forsythiae]
MNLTERFNAAQELAGRYVATDLRLKVISDAKRQLRRPSTEFTSTADVEAYEQAQASFEQEYATFDREQAELEAWQKGQLATPTGLYALLVGDYDEDSPVISIRVNGYHVYADEGQITLSPENQAKREPDYSIGTDYTEAKYILQSARQLTQAECGSTLSDDETSLFFFMVVQLMATTRLTAAVNRLTPNY